MSDGAWPALDRLLEAQRTAPARTGSVIATIYGDAILPRGGALAMADLLALMRRLGAGEGVVRTAISRLARDGLLHGSRHGRRSAYALTERGEAEFRAAVPRIYGAGPATWDGRLRLAFPDPGADRSALEQAGFQLLAPGVLVGPAPPPDGTLCLEGAGPPSALQAIAGRAWPLERLRTLYEGFVAAFASLEPVPGATPLDMMAARIALIHAWRRIALRDPQLPPGLLPPSWPGGGARSRCIQLYGAFAGPSETWLDGADSGTGPTPRGPDPARRWT